MSRNPGLVADVPAADALWKQLQAAPRRHDFFATLRRVEALHPQWPRLGQAMRPSQEAIRLGQEPDLDFAPAALSALERPEALPPRLKVLFFGLLGPNGPMPLHLTEYARERLRHHDDPALARFLDVFHHRLLTLFYRTWAQNQPVVQLDRPREDRFAAWLGACTGLGSNPTGQPGPTRPARLFQAGLLSQRSRHPEGLAKLLTQHFRVPFRIDEHVAQWLDIEAEDRQPLGFARNRPQRSDARMGRLGETSTSGRKRLDRQYRFCIVAGPLSLPACRAFLPGGQAWQELRSWVTQYCGIDQRWDLQLVLGEGQMPSPRLDRSVQLGVSTWVGRPAPRHARRHLRLRPGSSLRSVGAAAAGVPALG